MKKLFAFLVATAVIAGAVSVYAGGACCAAKADKAKMSAAGNSDVCGELTAKLNLTDDQKAKLSALKEECKKATSTSECREMMSKGLEKILTPEQLAQHKAECEKMSKACTMKSDKKS